LALVEVAGEEPQVDEQGAAARVVEEDRADLEAGKGPGFGDLVEL
jgi:hypothetical protein